MLSVVGVALFTYALLDQLLSSAPKTKFESTFAIETMLPAYPAEPVHDHE